MQAQGDHGLIRIKCSINRSPLDHVRSGDGSVVKGLIEDLERGRGSREGASGDGGEDLRAPQLGEDVGDVSEVAEQGGQDWEAALMAAPAARTGAGELGTISWTASG